MDQVAIYIDFENIAISAEEAYGRCDIEKFIGVAESYGRCAIKRAYGDWTRFTRYRQELLENAIDLTQLFRYGNYTKKNSADIVMAVDVIEAALTNPALGTFVLVTGDSDFTAVARKLRGYGRRVVGIGLRDATSDLLVRSCDEFIIYDTLMEKDESSTGFQLDDARQLALSTLQQLMPRFENGQVPVATLQQEMESRRPDLDIPALGFRGLQHFLEAQKELTIFAQAGDEPLVSLRSTLTARSEIDQILQYRTALNTAGFRLVEREIRQDVLQALYNLLSNEPATHTLDEAVLRLKEQYDGANLLRSRDDIQEVVRLIKQAGALASQPESWELDPLTLQPDLALADFMRLCESVYVVVLVQRNLTVDEEALARLLYGRADAREEVRALQALAGDAHTDTNTPARLENGYNCPVIWRKTWMRASFCKIWSTGGWMRRLPWRRRYSSTRWGWSYALRTSSGRGSIF